MNTQVYEEASEWLVEFRTGEIDHATRKRFDKWLSTSPEHVRAYLEVTNVWEVASAQSPAEPRDIEALIERARTTTNVVPLAPSQPEANASSSILSRRRAFFAAAASLLLVVTAAATYLYTQRNTYATAIGERRSILLTDGSTIDLNARSRVRVELSDRERHVDLLEGQALFRVAKDMARPFIVAANGTRVRAVGTQFDVNQRKRGLIVTVVEGTVAVSSVAVPVVPESSPEQAPAKSAPGISAHEGEILLDAGQKMTLSAAAPPAPQPADVDTATAWTQRRLIFDSTPLDDVAEEFNRNNRRPLVIEGARLEGFRISGAFSSTDPQPLLRFLRAQTGILVTEQSDRIVVSRSD